MSLILLMYLISLILFRLLTGLMFTPGGLINSTGSSAPLQLPRRPLQRCGRPRRPRNWARLNHMRSMIKTIRRGWCIMSMTSCFITSWRPCAVRMAPTALPQLVWRHLIFLLVLGRTGDCRLISTYSFLDSDFLMQVFFAYIDPYLWMVVLFHGVRGSWQNTWTISAKVPPRHGRRCRPAHGAENSRVIL